MIPGRNLPTHVKVFQFRTNGRCALVGTADNAKESWQVGQVVEGGLGKKKDVRNMERAAQNVVSYVCNHPIRLVQ